MSTFDETKVKRQSAGTASGGQFAEHTRSAPAGSLVPETYSEVALLVDAALDDDHRWKGDFERLDAIANNVAGSYLADFSQAEMVRRVTDAIEIADKHGIDATLPTDTQWPAGFSRLPEQSRPKLLWSKGDLSLIANTDNTLAIDGSRASTAYGESVTNGLSSELAAKGKTIISTGSYGISGSAARAALGARGKPVIVSASGIDRPYPAGHISVFERVAEQGLVVSTHPPGTTPTRQRFIDRHEIVASLSGAVLVVEAGKRSGAHGLVGSARKLNVPVGAVPGPVTSAASIGSNQMIAEGASVITDADSALALLEHAGPF
jgi:DNA processing protein